jgi:hypothetical protein
MLSQSMTRFRPTDAQTRNKTESRQGRAHDFVARSSPCLEKLDMVG